MNLKKVLKFKSAIIQVHTTIIAICTVFWNIQRCYAMDHGEGYYGKHEFLKKDRSKKWILYFILTLCTLTLAPNKKDMHGKFCT